MHEEFRGASCGEYKNTAPDGQAVGAVLSLALDELLEDEGAEG